MERSVLLNAVVKKYDETFKRHAVEMVLHGGKSVKQAAEELGVSQYSIYEWKKKFFPQAPLPGFAGKKPVSAGLTQDVEALQKLVVEQQRQIVDLTQQREILSLVLSSVESRLCLTVPP
jgi:transposase-like protein